MSTPSVAGKSEVTIRTNLNRLKRNSMIVGYSAFAVFAGGMFAGPLVAPFIIMAGFVVFAGITLYMSSIRCPKCKTAWRHLLSSGPIFKIDPLIQVCPYCRAEVDAPYENHG